MRNVICILALAFFTTSLVNQTHAENWPTWRGPNLDSKSLSTNIPVKWDANTNIKWKTKLPAWSAATPVIWEDKIFVISPNATPQEQDTAQQNRRRAKQKSPGGNKILLLCLSTTTGEQFWQQTISLGNRLQFKHNSSSPSPVTNGKHVWVTTGTGDIACFDFQGKRIWDKSLDKDYGKIGTQFGYASSPILIDGKLIFQMLHGRKTDDPSYLLALDPLTGKEMWKVNRPTDAIAESPDAYTTPNILIKDSIKNIVILGGDYVTGHHIDTGKELWRVGGLNPRKAQNYRIVPSPVVQDSIVYSPTRKVPLLAVKPEGNGNLETKPIIWKWEDSSTAPDVPSPIVDGKYFYMVSDNGRVTCLDSQTGAKLWGPIETGLGTISASPVLIENKLYITSEKAETAVVQVGAQGKLLSTNPLDSSYTLSSPAVAHNKLYIRTSQYLYCIGN